MSVNLNGPAWVDQWIGALTQDRCQVCGLGQTHALLCNGCRADLPWNSIACPGCAQPTAAPALCRDCLRRKPAFDRAFAPLILRGAVRRWVHGLKYRARFEQARMLGQLMATALRSRPGPTPELIIPVPIHFSRRVRRGYNQSLELARHLATALEIPIAVDAARVVRRPAEQIGQSASQRRRNLRGVFAVDMDLTGRHVALVDDVMTTGATLDALARAVRKAGAVNIEAWAAARTP